MNDVLFKQFEEYDNKVKFKAGDKLGRYIMFLESQVISNNNNSSKPMFFEELLRILGWQGGTIHQALAEVKRLKNIENIKWDLK